MIWFNKNISLEELLSLGKGSMSEFVRISFTEIGENYVKASMPVDERTKQPFGLLHGGASCVLAETLGSVASAMVVDHTRFQCVGIEINANHLRSAREGQVEGIVTPIHIGRTTHVWDIRISDAAGKLVCVSRLTVAILPINNQSA